MVYEEFMHLAILDWAVVFNNIFKSRLVSR